MIANPRTSPDRDVSSASPAMNAFTVDVEDYFQVQSFADRVDRGDWDGYRTRVVDNTTRILRLLDGAGVRGTFFVLGWVADRHPELVRSIAASGHEIGVHSYWHRLIYEIGPEAFAEDTRRACEVIGGLVDEPPSLYRAPSFSITRRSLWALEILADNGIRIDSSIFPTRHDTYGLPSAPPEPFDVMLADGVIREFPLTVWERGRMRLPIAGGGYFRLLPVGVTSRGLKEVNVRSGRPGVFYIHPWEVDPDQPRIRAGWRSSFRHYLNLRSTETKLRRLLKSLPFGTMTEALASYGREFPVYHVREDSLRRSAPVGDAEVVA